MGYSFDRRRETCPLCGSAAIEFLHNIESGGLSFTMERCAQCGFQFMNPPLSDASLMALYTAEYYEGKAGYSYWDERKSLPYARYVWEARCKKIRKLAPRGNFLDVGSSFGGLMDVAEDFGFRAYGVELSPYAADEALRRFPERVHKGPIESAPFPASSFSAITMIELIEHLKDPLSAIKKSHELLAPGGMLLIQTANMAGSQAQRAGKNYHYYLPGHLSCFSASNLEMALTMAGFTRVRFFYPVEFGLIPKLKKSRGNFYSLLDYRAWFRITAYHLLGKIHTRHWSITSSMVCCAWKERQSGDHERF